MHQRIACLLIPRFATDVCVLATPALADRPFAVVEGSSQRTVFAANERARGVCAGMTAKQARCACPNLTVVARDEAAERSASHALLNALESCSPQVEGAEPGTYFFAAGGLPRGEREALSAASELACALGFHAQSAVADDKFTARCAALTRGSCSTPARGSCIVPAFGSASFLAPLPMTLLPLAAGDAQRFELLGLRTLGQIAALPQAPLAARFGERARLYAALAGGKDATPLRPRHAVTVHEDRFAFDGAVVTLEPLLFALRGCITNVAARLAGAAHVCDRITVQLLFDAPAHRRQSGSQGGDEAMLQIPVSLAEPTACAGTMFELARIALESRDDLRPVEAVAVQAVPSSEPAPQPVLFERSGRSQRAALAATLARLHAALAPDDVVTVQPQFAASRLPERMQRATPIDSPRQFESQPKKKKKKAFQTSAESASAAPVARGAAALRLLDPPQPMPAPDKGARRAGPFRLSESWWERAADRDYYQMVDSSGALVLAFRDVHDDRWYLQGVFD